VKKNKPLFLAIILIIFLGFIAYANSLNGKFLWDDTVLVRDNAYIKNWSCVTKIFTKDIAAGGANQFNFYRPLQMLTYMIDYSFWKLNVVGYHLTNVILHIFVALCIYWLLNILYNKSSLSLLTSLFFLVHPIHTEAVSYISGRADSLAALFMLLCFIFYIKQLGSKNLNFCLLTLLSYIFALLSKENSLIFPALLLLYHYNFKQKVIIKTFLPILSIACIYITIRFTVLRSLQPYLFSTTTLPQRIPGFFVALTNYLRLLILPIQLHQEYGKTLFHFSSPQAIIGIAVLLSLLFYSFIHSQHQTIATHGEDEQRLLSIPSQVLGIFGENTEAKPKYNHSRPRALARGSRRLIKRNRNPLIFFSIFWFFIALLPVSNIYPIITYMSEHWLYLPSIGFFLVLASFLVSLYRNKKFKILAVTLITGLLFFYSYFTIKQNNYWKDPIIFYETTLKYAPTSPRIHNNLGLLYYEQGKTEEAVSLYKKAIELSPDFFDAYNNLANAYYKLGNNKEAIDLYKKAITLNPGLVDAYNNLANLYADIGDTEEAVALYKKAIEVNPDYANAYSNLGHLYHRQGQDQEALALYRRAVELNPVLVDAYNNLGFLYRKFGKTEQAVALYKKAIEINPNYLTAYFNLGNIYADTSKNKEAINAYQHAIEIDPAFAPAHFNLSVVYFRQKQYDLALKHCNKAIGLGYIVPAEFLNLLKPYRK
jgi:tetratricopeptide (TPR) repeat protein